MPKRSLQRFVETWQISLIALLVFAGLMTGLAMKWLEMDRLNEKVEAIANNQERVLGELSERTKQLEGNMVGPDDEIITRRIAFDIENLERGRHITEFREYRYPAASIMGWHMKCSTHPDKVDDRDIESLFVEPDEQENWSIYVEHRSACHTINVYLMFVGKNLIETEKSKLQPSVSDRSNWKILKVLQDNN